MRHSEAKGRWPRTGNRIQEDDRRWLRNADGEVISAKVTPIEPCSHGKTGCVNFYPRMRMHELHKVTSIAIVDSCRIRKLNSLLLELRSGADGHFDVFSPSV